MGVAMQNLLLTLAALACPIGMGLMMLLMARQSRSRPPTAPSGGAEQELARLRAEVADLQAERSDMPEAGRG
ncbi:hypothetical protein [Amycolatopsis tucumanensis]|uniref:DUF2933 domain-containing protein n=1 Tax=Amycolatopsis tucumanensis TaxID=401106 RepID=A0ABP7JIM3_9PSEU|nr:hypothetical protein [Amycolatopsis tucumanensis]MCF6425232.1 hypothetical protein [Amycolatopsis tucumanensis]